MSPQLLTETLRTFGISVPFEGAAPLDFKLFTPFVV
jgi:hypothetical protein